MEGLVLPGEAYGREVMSDGGRTLYGFELGVLMLDTSFPRLVGDVGNAETWPFPVRYRIVRGATSRRVVQEPDDALLGLFIDGARDLDRDGVAMITTSCGFLAMYQQEIAATVSVPFLSSSLLQVPHASRLMGRHRKVGILTMSRSDLTEAHYAGAGWSSADVPVVVSSFAPGAAFWETYLVGREEVDPDELETELLELGQGSAHRLSGSRRAGARVHQLRPVRSRPPAGTRGAGVRPEHASVPDTHGDIGYRFREGPLNTRAGPTKHDTVLVAASHLENFTIRVFRALGMSAEHAGLMGNQIAWAHARGHAWLGAPKIIQYGTRIRTGVTSPVGEPEVVSEAGAFTLLDAQDTFSQIAGVRAMELAIRKAGQAGAAVSVLRNTTSAGALGYFAMLAADRRMIGMANNNAPPLMPPWGGTSKLIGNQAFAIASPAGRHAPVLLDMALSEMTLVRYHEYEERGKQLPEGVAFDVAGRPTTDPAEALAGMMVPMGGHRGYGLAVMWEVITGVLSGSLRFLDEVTMPGVFDRPQAVSMFFLAIDPQMAMPYEDFIDRVDALVDRMHASRRAPGVERVSVPGERSARLARDRMRNGIPISRALVEDLDRFGAEVGVSWE